MAADEPSLVEDPARHRRLGPLQRTQELADGRARDLMVRAPAGERAEGAAKPDEGHCPSLRRLRVRGLGPAALDLYSHALAPVAELPVLQVLSAKHIVADLTLGLGTVVHDYLASSEIVRRRGSSETLVDANAG